MSLTIPNVPRKGSWTQTFSGLQFFPLDPRPEDISIIDIAHALARVNRYNGHTEKPYSVAQHAVYVSMECDPADALWGLLHDASEAYVADLVMPAKRGLPEYVAVLEDPIMACVTRKFWLRGQMPDSVKRADMALLAAEYRDLFPVKKVDWQLPVPAVARKIKPVSYKKAEAMFLKRFDQLWTPHIQAISRDLVMKAVITK